MITKVHVNVLPEIVQFQDDIRLQRLNNPMQQWEYQTAEIPSLTSEQRDITFIFNIHLLWKLPLCPPTYTRAHDHSPAMCEMHSSTVLQIAINHIMHINSTDKNS